MVLQWANITTTTMIFILTELTQNDLNGQQQQSCDSLDIDSTRCILGIFAALDIKSYNILFIIIFIFTLNQFVLQTHFQKNGALTV